MSADTVATETDYGAPRPQFTLLRLALRELRGGLAGFYVFVGCIALGVAVIAGVGALADAVQSSFVRQGATLLGGDLTFTRPNQRAEPAEQAAIARFGTMSETASLRAMARRLDGSDQMLIEAKGVDGTYPLIGALVLEDDIKQADALAGRGAAADPILLERLGLKRGDSFRLGNIEVELRAVIRSEPDKIAERLSFGPRVMVSTDTLLASGLADLGSLTKWRYAVRLPDTARGAEGNLTAAAAEVRKALPESGFTILDRRDPSPRVTQTLERVRQFLTLIGLTALLVGGVGVANAVATYIDRRRKVIATFRSLGATGRTVFALHLVQVIAITAIGIVIGLAVGLMVPSIVDWLAGEALPFRAEATFSFLAVGMAIAYGLLVALLFTLWPLGRIEQIRPSVLFRDEVSEERRWPAWPFIAATIAVGIALLALAILSSDSKRIALYFCAGAAGILILFAFLGSAVTYLARRLPRPRRPSLALAIGSLGAPGGLTRAVVLSLGSGLSLLVAVALVDASIVNELDGRVPKNSPNFFVLDLPRDDVAGFRGLVEKEVPGAIVNQAPMLRGRIVALKGRPVEELKAPPEAAWVLNGDRGLSYSDEVPEGSTVVAGQWWAKDYSGEPLVSFEDEIARRLGLDIGDAVTVNVLGRNITARIANLRDVHWESLAINFVMVFSPNTLQAAPHNILATISLDPATSLAKEAQLARAIGQAYPATTAIRVKDAINNFNTLFRRIITAVRAAGGVTLLAGALVLAGALAAAQRRRLQTAVILKALGATRRRILAAHAMEYALLALIAATLALLLGGLSAWLVTTRIMDLPFVFSGAAILQALGVSLALVALIGGLGTWQVLRAPPVPYLRSE
ncbi:FtsX-like permease family protein [Hyphomicrobium sp. CS1BSMeth3]|uniref:ABC transporter permease n=1 Tax=Hyphomicrobium sp. CS1BSMeth3 TaxID=1892844 RepID=UPI0009311755|nr:FtsX-like permease family protein [Hyphomicrobium sp. CS1BSMeth3]